MINKIINKRRFEVKDNETITGLSNTFYGDPNKGASAFVIYNGKGSHRRSEIKYPKNWMDKVANTHYALRGQDNQPISIYIAKYLGKGETVCLNNGIAVVEKDLWTFEHYWGAKVDQFENF